MSLSDFDFFKCCNIRDCVCNTVDKQFSKSDVSLAIDNKFRRQNLGQRYFATMYLNVNEFSEYIRRISIGSNYDGLCMKLDFEVLEFFMLGVFLGLVLVYRRMISGDDFSF